MGALGLAFAASLAWGGSDFLAGVASRRLGVLTVLVLSQAAGLAALLCVLAVSGQPAPPARAAAVAACAGIAELTGFATLYASLARSPMGIVAPLSSLGAVVPVVVAVSAGERPGALACAGIAVALAGAALAAREPGEAALRGVAPGALLGLVSALAFGAFFVAMNGAADHGGAVWSVSVNRATSLAILVAAVLWRRGLSGFRLGDLRAAGAVGVLDAGANALFALALTEGLASTVSVIGSLYPVTTVLLAAVVLRERPARPQALGVLCVLAGVALVGAGG
ncbi:MAG: EamA family transporter [Solirubrobacteraceae bacterium]